ncbi:MAG TPA: hypothetical protein VLR29_01870 [Flavobacterium sp.]|nr:hypothetical protein [Flavobacterium sp.]
MKKIIAPVLLSFLFQSCYTYKTINLANLESEKNYIVELKEGATVNALYKESSTDSLTFVINTNTVQIPINKIETIKQEKVSVLKLVGGGVLVTAGIIILINDAPKSQFMGTDID